jgi:hypothetical protein
VRETSVEIFVSPFALAYAYPAPPDSTWAYALCFCDEYLAAFRALQMLSVNVRSLGWRNAVTAVRAGDVHR